MEHAESAEMVASLMHVHYYLMETRKDFWSDKLLREMDTMICVAASDLRKKITEAAN